MSRISCYLPDCDGFIRGIGSGDGIVEFNCTKCGVSYSAAGITIAAKQQIDALSIELAVTKKLVQDKTTSTDEYKRLAQARIEELETDCRKGLRIAYELTQETQTVEEACTDLVRLVRKARAERDVNQECITRLEKRLAVSLADYHRDAQPKIDQLAEQVSLLREATEERIGYGGSCAACDGDIDAGCVCGHRALVKALAATVPEAPPASFTCSCTKACRSREEMQKEHGTPEEYVVAVWRACDQLMITTAEAEAAVNKYMREWARVPVIK